jgi:serine/threonine protein kinase
MKTLADLTTLDSLYYFLKHSIRSLQAIHACGKSHGAIQPHTLSIDSPYECLEDSIDVMYSAPEIALGLAVVEKYKPEEAVQMWKQESIAMHWIEQWIPSVAEEYTTRALQKLIGTPVPEQQSDIWSLGLSYLSMYNALYTKETPFSEKEQFFEAISEMLRLRGRKLPSVEPAFPADETDETAGPAETTAVHSERRNGNLAAARHSGRMMLTEPIRRGERNKTRRNPHN